MAEVIGLKAIIDISQFNKGLGAYNKGLDQMNKKTTQTTKGATSSFAKMGPALLSVGALAGGAAVAGLVAFGKAAIQEGRAFTQAMSNVAAVSGAVGGDFAKLEAQAKQLGATTKFTGVEAAEGMSFLAMAGFETNEILSAMPGTLNLAAAANLGLGQSADIVSNILTGFGASAESTDQFVDVLTNTFTTSNTSLTQLGQAMKNVAPVAANLGLSVEETAAALGKMGDAGIQGGAAGTQLKNALLNLAAPSKQQAALMKELGIEIFDTNGQMKSLPEVVGAVNQGISGLGEQQQIAAVKTLAGKRAIAGFQVLLNQGQGALESYTQSLTKSGTAAEVARTQLDNLEGDITLLQSAFSGFKIAAFELMEPTLRAASQALTVFVGELTKGAAAWEQVFNDISAIQEWKRANVEAALDAGKSYGPYQRQVELAIGATQEITQATFDVTKANQEYIGVANQVAMAINETTLAYQDVQEPARSLAKIQSDSSVESARWQGIAEQNVLVLEEMAQGHVASASEAEAYAEAQQIAIAAEEARKQAVLSLLSTMGTFFSGVQDAQQKALESEKEFNASIADIQAGAVEAQEAAKASANEKLIELEEQRAAEEHRILTGAHARTTEANDALLAANNAHFAELANAESASLAERQAEVEADFAKREGQAQAARAKELAEQQAHLEELKLNAALATLESTGQLEQFTGGLTVSASEAAALIKSGVIPVTEELGAAVQSTLAGLQEKEGEAAAQAVSNQALLQQAYAGTLVPLEAQAMALGTGIPEAAAMAQASMGLANADIIAGAQNTTLAAQEQDLALQNLGTTTFPTLGIAAETATQMINEGLTTAITPIGQIDLTLNNIAVVTLPLLQETFLIVITLIIEQMVLLLETGIMPVDLALVIMTTVTLPNLQATAIAVAAATIAAFVPVETLFQSLIALMIELTTETEKFGVAAEKAGKDAATGFDSAAKKLKDKLIPAMKDAVVVAQLLAQALKEVSDAVNAAGGAAESATGTGFAKGIGFQAGTPANTGGLLGLGFQIPGTGFGDTFGPMFLEPGEELLVTPRGTSIEGLIFSRLANLLRGTTVQGGSVTNNTTNIEMNMNIQTGSSAQANIQQFAVMKGLVGA